MYGQGHSQTSLKKLRCEWLENPIGIDAKAPRFTWQIATDQPGYLQAAYELIVSDNKEDIENGSGNVWGSGQVEALVLPVVYQGSPLEPFTRYFWKVRLKDEKGEWSDWSPTAFFEMGMMEQKNWKGHWITDSPDYHKKEAPYFRKEIDIEKKVTAARAYISAAGLYELSINGNRVGDHQLDPMYTRFDRRNLYVTYDVTERLQSGKNAIGVLLGNGWYNHQSTAVWYFDKAPWRARPKFCMDIRIQYEDGTSETVGTQQGWKTSLGPIIFNSIYTAEHYDARLEQVGWDTPTFDDSDWQNAMATNAPSPNISAQVLHPIRHVSEIKTKGFKKVTKDKWLYDFGKNMSGVTQLKVSGEEGTVIRLKHVERLDSEGNADMSNIDVHYRPTDDSDPFQTDIFILSGKGLDTFMPKFNYKGFQYVEVTADRPIKLTQESLTAYFMHSDVPPVGELRSSDPVLEKIWQAANASYLSNLFGYPTDCPQREKNGWTGDAHIAIETGLYNYDGITVYEKWMADHRDEQQANGVLPAIIPSNGWGYTWANGPDWTSTIAIIPWNLYLFYGDPKILEDCYENIERYVAAIGERSKDGLTEWGLGDWVPVKSVTPKELTSSIYYYVDVSILSDAAKILGKEEDHKKYATLSIKIKDAINNKYLNKETGIYGTGLQTELSAPLYWGVVPHDLTEKVAQNLAYKVEADKKHIDVGLLGTKTILNALSENGFADLAWEVASQNDYPSWGWWIANGATTFYENWDPGSDRDLSMNHIMFGEINAWYYKALGGIFPDRQVPGFKNIILRPNFVKGLEHFEASHESPYGKIVSSWTKKGKNVTYLVEIPPNSTARMYLDGEEIKENGENIDAPHPTMTKLLQSDGKVAYRLKSGKYHFTLRMH